MAKRVDYQDPYGNLEEVQERRNAEIRAWAEKDIAESNVRFAAEQEYVTTTDDWDTLEGDALDQHIVEDLGGAEDPEQPVDNPVDEEEEETDPDAGEKQEAEAPAPAKKAPAKKAAAAPKEAPSKE